MAKSRQDQASQDPEPVTEAEGQAVLDKMEQLAGEWRRRLQDPATRRMLKAGTLQLSPLVKDLLAAFPLA